MKKPISAHLNWNSQTPYSDKYDDIYFSTENGLAETEFVFLQKNNLDSRFSSEKQTIFTIAETGFGTGLNFLAAWKLWQETAPKDTHLHFISVEKYPISIEDLTKALSLWPELDALSKQLIAQYPPPTLGFHQLNFDDDRVTLTLMLGDAIACYSQLNAQIDAWFLDGFAPSKNPDMWQAGLFQQMTRLSHPGTTFATFTCAGIVKRGLKEAGFEIKKVPGFGRKREMLIGTYTETHTNTEEQEKGCQYPTSSPAWFRLPKPTYPEKTALIVGAGIAGCSTAYSLARRGWQVILIDRHNSIAQEGSGNRQGALYAKLPVQPIPASRIHLSGFLYSSRFLQHQLPENRDIWSPCGLIQIAASDKEKKRQIDLAESGNYPEDIVQHLSTEQASEIAGTPLSNSALYFPDAGWVSPPLLCQWLIDHPNIEVITDHEISSLEFDQHKHHWLAKSNQNLIAEAAIAVVASAADSRNFDQLNHLSLQKIRGQVSITKQTDQPITLNTVLCSEGYISPAKEKRFCFGATFELKDEGTDIRNDGHEHNLSKVQQMAPILSEQLKNQSTHSELDGRVSFRCASPDKLPIIGPAPIFEAFKEDYSKLGQDRTIPIDKEPKHFPGLFVNIAHGSKGLITGPISGEIIASMLSNEPLPLEQQLIDCLNPARFIIKNLIRRAI